MAARQQPVDGPRVLIISHDVVDVRMAGPGIRYWELARVLARHMPVTLAVPGRTALSGDGFTLHVYQPGAWETLRTQVKDSEVLMPCGHTLISFPDLANGDRPIVVDGYDPFPVETLALFAGEPVERQEALQRDALALLRQQCLLGDFFICASERQRDWWLGLLQAYGRINPHTYAADPTLRQLVDVVPFGLPDQPPQHSQLALKGVLPGIGANDRVVLWGGGIWEWLDPLTLIRAMAKVVKQRPDVRLVFPGTRHPNTKVVPDMAMRRRAVRLAQELELLGQCVFFGDWVDYAGWPNYLLEADVGVSLHYHTLEAHLAFRTRVLDYIWAELPMLITRGDVASDLVVRHGLGSVVDFEDVGGVATAILALLEADPEKGRVGFENARAELTWERVAEPLVAFCRARRRAADLQRRRSVMSVVDGRQLQDRLAYQESELERLRDLVAGFEGGRFIRFMRWVKGFWHNTLNNRLLLAWREWLHVRRFYSQLTREIGQAGNHAFVDRAYWRVLGRAPDAAGFENYTDALATGRLSRFEIVGRLVKSTEFRTLPRPVWGITETLHLARCQLVSRLPPADRVLDVGGAAPNSIQGALFVMGYPHRVRSLTIVDLPPADRLGDYSRGDSEKNGGWIDSEMGPIRYLHNSMTDLSAIESGSIDMAVSSQSIEHVSEDDGLTVMREALRVLRPGGIFFLDTPNGKLARIQSPTEFLHPEHKVEYRVNDLLARLTEVGFEIKEVGGICPMPRTVQTGVFDERELLNNARLHDDAEISYLFFVKCVKPG